LSQEVKRRSAYEQFRAERGAGAAESEEAVPCQ